MALEIIDRCSLHRHFLHQVDVMDIETVIRDEITFKEHPYGHGAMLYDAALRDPHLVADRALSYFLNDLGSLFPRHSGLAWVEVRKVTPVLRHKLPLGTSAQVLCLVGSFENGRVQIGEAIAEMDGGDCLVIPDNRVKFRVLPPKAGEAFVLIAHGTKKK